MEGIVSVTAHHDGTVATGTKVPIVGTDSNLLSVTAGKNSLGAVNKGFTIDNTGGHSLSLSHTKIPDFGSQATAAANVNVFQNANHKVDANAHVTHSMPSIPNVPNFNTIGGGVDYTYKNTMGASVGASTTPLLHRNDYSAMGNVNLFQSPQNSVDLSAGFSKTVTPHMNTGWQPAANVTFTRFFSFK